MRDGQVLEDRLRRVRVSKDDIIEAARMQHGVASWDEIDAAVLETGGGITIICKRR
jgi:uncharacterized membrane protein YcaP (DUF421 family)